MASPKRYEQDLLTYERLAKLFAEQGNPRTIQIEVPRSSHKAVTVKRNDSDFVYFSVTPVNDERNPFVSLYGLTDGTDTYTLYRTALYKARFNHALHETLLPIRFENKLPLLGEDGNVVLGRTGSPQTTCRVRWKRRNSRLWFSCSNIKEAIHTSSWSHDLLYHDRLGTVFNNEHDRKLEVPLLHHIQPMDVAPSPVQSKVQWLKSVEDFCTVSHANFQEVGRLAMRVWSAAADFCTSNRHLNPRVYIEPGSWHEGFKASPLVSYGCPGAVRHLVVRKERTNQHIFGHPPRITVSFNSSSSETVQVWDDTACEWGTGSARQMTNFLHAFGGENNRARITVTIPPYGCEMLQSLDSCLSPLSRQFFPEDRTHATTCIGSTMYLVEPEDYFGDPTYMPDWSPNRFGFHGQQTYKTASKAIVRWESAREQGLVHVSTSMIPEMCGATTCLPDPLSGRPDCGTPLAPESAFAWAAERMLLESMPLS